MGRLGLWRWARHAGGGSGASGQVTKAWSWAPFLEARVSHDCAEHHVLDRPHDRPVWTGLGVATIAFYGVLFPGRRLRALATTFHVSLKAAHVDPSGRWCCSGPPVAGYLGWRICRDLATTRPPAPTISEA